MKRLRRKALRFGRRGERLAAELLREAGCEILTRNYRAKHGEIDVVARDGEVVAFVEVKARRTIQRSRPSEAVGPGKQRCLILSAHQYLREIGYPHIRFRFDIVEVVAVGWRLKELTYYPNAFQASPEVPGVVHFQ